MTDVFVTVTTGKKLVLLLPPDGSDKLQDLSPKAMEALTIPYGRSDLVTIPTESWSFLANKNTSNTSTNITSSTIGSTSSREIDKGIIAKEKTEEKEEEEEEEEEEATAAAAAASGWAASIFRDAETQHWVLEAGETVYIPRGWIHFIANLELSLSLSTQSTR